MEIRQFKESDTLFLIELFRKTVHTVCRKDYSQKQLNVWAPEKIDVDRWIARFNSSFTVVAEEGQKIAGFTNLETDGCIDMFYVAAELQSQGVGSRLFDVIEKEARRRGLKKIQSDVSLTARSFFRSKGFFIEKEYSKGVGSVTFPSVIMAKILV